MYARLLRPLLGWCTVPAGTAALDAPCWSLWCSVTGNGWWDEYLPGLPLTSLPLLAWPPTFSPRLCSSTTVRLPPNRFVFARSSTAETLKRAKLKMQANKVRLCVRTGRRVWQHLLCHEKKACCVYVTLPRNCCQQQAGCNKVLLGVIVGQLTLVPPCYLI